MKVNIDQIKDILYSHFSGRSLTAGEEALLEQWLKQSAVNRNLFNQIRDKSEIDQYLSIVMDDRHTEAAFQRFKANSIEEFTDANHNEPAVRPVRHLHFARKWQWAAAAVILLAAGTYYWKLIGKQTLPVENSKSLQADIGPGGALATLTLADGSKITLDSAANGKLAQQGNAQVVKLANGQIAYNAGIQTESEMLWNTMSTPNGGQYQLVLPDGTKAWLNASSSITFPAAFAGNKRQVKIKGEVYFEVAKKEQQPFMVDVNGKALVQVLGTSFNINSYEDEDNINTTLLEGSVRIVGDNQTVVLKPGQQALIAAADRQSAAGKGILVNSSVDTDQVLAWKNGIFDFTGADLKTVMRQLTRWYNIEVEYRGPNSNITFQGKMYRNVNLKDVLEALQKMGVRTELQGRKLIVF
ncbi:ferric-dicitrate binding protein FerR (iron transport regulator) [Chitinophaga terrae (ex Kim and Jung 2007)]|uniref:FecR family protein n=1 Tax=Chitinophaga terrae (ex Kim and Jung 2007) TaxID=408074 RepID=UPI00277E645A|nr:FecR family protein [Chitinophaga terrae (ex Kim and Jung 2007)]MDQ0109813.1 ferric-dicitrate binding protein FerR (iron transport regulator) [Chitinophaga terrae (ex Kim and Jung 2007)]